MNTVVAIISIDESDIFTNFSLVPTNLSQNVVSLDPTVSKCLKNCAAQLCGAAGTKTLKKLNPTKCH